MAKSKVFKQVLDTIVEDRKNAITPVVYEWARCRYHTSKEFTNEYHMLHLITRLFENQMGN